MLILVAENAAASAAAAVAASGCGGGPPNEAGHGSPASRAGRPTTAPPMLLESCRVKVAEMVQAKVPLTLCSVRALFVAVFTSQNFEYLLQSHGGVLTLSK